MTITSTLLRAIGSYLATLGVLAIAIASYNCAAARAETPVLGTIGFNSAGALTTIQSSNHGAWLEGSKYSWHLSFDDFIGANFISDFDGDGYDDFIVRSGWGIGIVGNDAGDNLVLKAAEPYGTDIGKGWVLSATDWVAAVGRFGASDRPGQLVLKGTMGFAFVGVHDGGLQAMTVVPYDTWITGGGFGWRVGLGDQVIGVGRLNGVADCLVIMSGWGMGVWVPEWSGTPTLLSIHQNGTTFQD